MEAKATLYCRIKFISDERRKEKKKTTCSVTGLILKSTPISEK
jgi:hypothetical protein